MTSPFSIQPEADILGAITARLRTFTEIVALVNTGISGELPEGFSGGAFIRLRHTGGPTDMDRRLIGKAQARIDITCYGSSLRAANQLMGYTVAALCPPQGSGRGSFTQNVTNAGTVQVDWIFPNAEKISSREPDTGFRYSWVPVIAAYSVINR